jgi:methylmalonyl-CoA mutase N-terminal domain/subunit
VYVDQTVGCQQSAKLKALRARRSNDEVRRRLDALKTIAAQEPQMGSNRKISEANTMPFIVEAVRAYATVGEICEAMRCVYGTYVETMTT